MLEFKKLTDFPRGTMYDILQDAYSYDSRNKEIWDDNWKESDDFFYDNPEIAEKYGLVTCIDGEPIGFITWDPRNRPEYVEIGHNGIREKYKKQGYGHKQLEEAVRRIKEFEGLKRIIVCTNSNLTTPRNYESVGFSLYDRKPNETESAYTGDYLYYEILLLPESVFLTEADERYADELQRFKYEVLEADKDNDDQFAGCMGLRDCSTSKEWIDICKLRKFRETCEQAGITVPSTTYFAIRECDKKLVGVIDLRHHINHPILSTWGGHCGYSVRPSERGRGYATEMLRLNVLNAEKMGIDKMLVVCDADNIASEKTILANGGQLENIIEVDGCKMKRFWIKTGKV